MKSQFDRSLSPISLSVDALKPNPSEKASATAFIYRPLFSQIGHHVDFRIGFTRRDGTIQPLYKSAFSYCGPS